MNTYWVVMATFLVGCGSISVDTIDTCSIDVDSFAGVRWNSTLNCSNVPARVDRQMTGSRQIIDRLIDRATAVEEESRRIGQQAKELGIEEKVKVKVRVKVDGKDLKGK